VAEELDLPAAHRYFSVVCFNRAWDLIDKPARTADEDEEMLRLGMASLWHWSQRADCTPTNLSIGLWQVSRIFALLGQAHNALSYARRCLEISQAIEPVYLGYAYEALARAEAIAGNRAESEGYLAEARRAAERVMEEEERTQLLEDLKTI